MYDGSVRRLANARISCLLSSVARTFPSVTGKLLALTAVLSPTDTTKSMLHWRNREMPKTEIALCTRWARLLRQRISRLTILHSEIPQQRIASTKSLERKEPQALADEVHHLRHDEHADDGAHAQQLGGRAPQLSLRPPWAVSTVYPRRIPTICGIERTMLTRKTSAR